MTFSYGCNQQVLACPEDENLWERYHWKKSLYRSEASHKAFKVDINHSIRKWAKRMVDLQSYLPHMLWEAGEFLGEKLVPFYEHEETREIFDGAIPKQQQSRLTNID